MIELKKIMLICLLFSSCITQKQMENKRDVNFKVLVGLNKGGIVENTDLSLVENTQPDAFTGATKTGFNVGANVDFPLIRNNIETGLNIITNRQIFTYNDLENNYAGRRNFTVSQIRVPVSYNIHFLKQKYPDGLFQLKLGYSLGYSIINVQDKSTTLPTYSLNRFLGGVLLGLNIIPVTFRNNSKLGFNVELFRAFNPAYKDFYNVGKMPGLSYFKFCVLYIFKH